VARPQGNLDVVGRRAAAALRAGYRVTWMWQGRVRAGGVGGRRVAWMWQGRVRARVGGRPVQPQGNLDVVAAG
jgi:hypothetical protein